MAASDLVPCYYTGQDVLTDQPAETLPRHAVRELKAQKLGRFVVNGKFFLFFKPFKPKLTQAWDGPFGIGNLLPFFKRQNPQMQPEKLHYAMPHANDSGMRRHYSSLLEHSLRHKVSVRRGAQIAAEFTRTRLLTKSNLPAAALNSSSLELA